MVNGPVRLTASKPVFALRRLLDGRVLANVEANDERQAAEKAQQLFDAVF